MVSKRKVNTHPASNPCSKMVSCLQDMLEQRWHTSSGSNQPISDLTQGPLHEMEPVPNTAGVTKKLTLRAQGPRINTTVLKSKWP